MSQDNIKKSRPIGPQWTIEQYRASKKKYRQKPGYRAKESKRWRDKDPVRAALRKRRYEFRRKYGIEPEVADAMLQAQGGECAICGRAIKLGGRAGAKVDHNHATGRVRGILCNNCNLGLGQFKDDELVIASAAEYLSRHSAVAG